MQKNKPAEIPDFVEARTVSRIGESYLIEFESGDDLKRVILPVPVSGMMELAELETGVPHGVPWEAVLKPASPTPADFGRELRRRGVWTAEDARTRVNDVYAALQAVYGVDIAAVLTAANQAK